jgi:hypothetical protein
MVDGETSERLWSILGRKSRLVKYMSKVTRAELLEDSVLHLAKRNIRRQIQRLQLRLKKTCALAKKMEQEWRQLCVCEDAVLSWLQAERERLSNSTTSAPQTQIDYLDKQIKGLALRFFDLNHHRTLESSLQEGTKTQLQINAKIAQVLDQVKKLVGSRNAMYSTIAGKLTASSVFDVESSFWSADLPLLPYQRDAIDSFSLWKRSEEEKVLLSKDILALRNSIEDTLSQVNSHVCSEFSISGNSGLARLKSDILNDLEDLIEVRLAHPAFEDTNSDNDLSDNSLSSEEQ